MLLMGFFTIEQKLMIKISKLRIGLCYCNYLATILQKAPSNINFLLKNLVIKGYLSCEKNFTRSDTKKYYKLTEKGQQKLVKILKNYREITGKGEQNGG